MQLKHHPLGFSSLERRDRCPLSLTLEQECQNDPNIKEDSKDADEGTFLHDKAWDDREGLTDEQSYLMHVIDTELDRLATLHGIEKWVGEVTLPIKDPNGDEYSFGTPDIYGLFTDEEGLKGGVLIDNKFGRDPVAHPYKNHQIRAGALALHQEFGLDYVIGVIIQPRVRRKDHPSTRFRNFKAIMVDLLRIRNECMKDRPEGCSGEWCKYCKALKKRCPIVHKVEGEIATTRLDVISFDNAEELYAKAQLVEKRCKAIKNHCKQLTILKGGELGRLEIKVSKGSRSVDNIQKFYESIQEHIEIQDFLKLCKVDLGKLEDKLSTVLVNKGVIQYKNKAREWIDKKPNIIVGAPKKSINLRSAK
jgi:hypothetical protein